MEMFTEYLYVEFLLIFGGHDLLPPFNPPLDTFISSLFPVQQIDQFIFDVLYSSSFAGNKYILCNT